MNIYDISSKRAISTIRSKEGEKHVDVPAGFESIIVQTNLDEDLEAHIISSDELLRKERTEVNVQSGRRMYNGYFYREDDETVTIQLKNDDSLFIINKPVDIQINGLNSMLPAAYHSRVRFVMPTSISTDSSSVNIKNITERKNYAIAKCVYSDLLWEHVSWIEFVGGNDNITKVHVKIGAVVVNSLKTPIRGNINLVSSSLDTYSFENVYVGIGATRIPLAQFSSVCAKVYQIDIDKDMIGKIGSKVLYKFPTKKEIPSGISDVIVSSPRYHLPVEHDGFSSGSIAKIEVGKNDHIFADISKKSKKTGYLFSVNLVNTSKVVSRIIIRWPTSDIITDPSDKYETDDNYYIWSYEIPADGERNISFRLKMYALT